MVVECTNCGAPLDARQGATSVRCAYCKKPNKVGQARVVVLVTPPDWQPPSQWTPPPQFGVGHTPLNYDPSKAMRTSVIMSLVITLITAGAPLWIFFGPQLMDLLSPWDGEDTYVCDGNDNSTLSGVKVNTDASPAIVVKSNCSLRIIDSEIDSEDFIEVRGNGKVRIENSTITMSGRHPITIESNGSFRADDSHFLLEPEGSGKATAFKATGNFDIVLNDSDVTVTAGKKKGEIIVFAVGGNKKVSLRDSTVTIDDDPRPGKITLFDLSALATATFEDGKLEANGRSVHVNSPRAKVVFSGTDIEAKLAGSFEVD